MIYHNCCQNFKLNKSFLKIPKFFIHFRDNFAKQLLSASTSDKSNRKGSTIMTAHLLDGKVVTAGQAHKIASPLPLSTKQEPPIPLSQLTQMPVLIFLYCIESNIN